LEERGERLSAGRSRASTDARVGSSALVHLRAGSEARVGKERMLTSRALMSILWMAQLGIVTA
jgi:hypothetical protein